MGEAAIWSELGNLYTLLSEYDAAIDAFERAMSLENENPRIYDCLAFACYKKGLYEKAQDFFEKAMQLSEDDQEKSAILRHLGDLHVGLRKYRRAAMVYETADLFSSPATPLDPDATPPPARPPLVTLPPQPQSTLDGAEIEATASSDIPRAVDMTSASPDKESWRLPVQQAGADNRARRTIGIKQAESGAHSESAVETVTQQSPMELHVARQAAEVNASQTDKAQSVEDRAPVEPSKETREPRDIEIYKMITQANPANDRAWFTLGNNLKNNGREREAIDAYATALALNPGAEAYHFELAVTHASLREYEAAVTEFSEVVQLAPDNLFAQAALAACYRHLGKLDEMKKHADLIALRMTQESNYNRACFESICGNTERAVQLLQAATAEDGVTPEMLQKDTDLDFVREAPSFKALLASCGR